MSQTETGKAAAADERIEAARSFVRTVKAATRRKYTPEEKIRIMLEGFRREVTVSDLCRREGIKSHPRQRARCYPAGGPSAQAGERGAKASGRRSVP